MGTPPDAKATHAPTRDDEADRRPFRARPRELLDLLKAAGVEFLEDKSPKQAAALAYYTLFALGPLLVLAIGIAALVVDAQAARDAVLAQVEGLLGAAGAEGIGELISGADRERVGILGTTLGLALLAFSAAAVFGQLKEALNRVWEVEARKVDGFLPKVRHAVRKNLLSFAGVVGSGFLLVVSLLASALIAAAGAFFEGLVPGAEAAWQVVNVLLSLVVVALVFAAMFRFLPDARITWRDVMVGAAVTALLFVVGQVALGYYLGAGPIATRFGAAGAILVVLVWVYYSSMIVFFGAEITQVYANRYGSRVRPSRDAQPLQEAVLERDDAPHREGLRDEGRGRKHA